MNGTDNSAGPRLTRRAIADGDLEEIEKLFSVGFPDRPNSYWRNGFARLRTRSVPEGYPRTAICLKKARRSSELFSQTIFAYDTMTKQQYTLICRAGTWNRLTVNTPPTCTRDGKRT